MLAVLCRQPSALSFSLSRPSALSSLHGTLPTDPSELGNARTIVLLYARLNLSVQLLGLHSWEAGRINKTSCRNWRQWGDN